MPWVENGLSETERETVDDLIYIAVGDVANLKAALGLTWLQGEISEVEYNTIHQIGRLGYENEKAAATIIAKPWVQDGVTETEYDAIYWIRWLDHKNEKAATAIVAMPWMQDDITETESDAIKRLYGLADKDETAAGAIIAMRWMQDDITEMESDAIKRLYGLADKNETAAGAIIAMRWMQDDITETESDAIKRLYWLADKNEKAATAIVALPWMQDDITETEREAIQWLYGLADKNEKAATAIVAMPWMQDDITETESDAIKRLYRLADKNEKAAGAIIAMPFLESIEPDDVLAMYGMRNLAYDGLLSALIDHPTLQSGITDTQTTLVTAAAILRDAEQISRMLDPGYAAIETLSSGTELTPHLEISIIRTGTQPQPGTADALKDAVEFSERTMQLPLPTSHVIVVLNDDSVTSGYAGTNYGFAVGYLPKYEQRQDTWEWRKLQAGLVHEIAHYYWRGNADWIDEGMADTIEYLHGLEDGLSPGQLKPRRGNCEAHDLEMLSEWDPPKTSNRFRCNYYLGQMLFQELLENLGKEEFNERLRELYMLSLAEREEDRTPGIDAVRQVFKGQTGIVNKHWSGAVNAPENRPFDEGIDRESHDLIGWNQLPTYDGHSVAFEGILLGDAVLANPDPKSGGYQNFILRSADKGEYLGSILPPLSVGEGSWILDDPGDSVAPQYLLVPATRADGMRGLFRRFIIQFPFPEALGNPSDYVVGVWGFRDGTRTPEIGENVDVLGYARIRVN